MRCETLAFALNALSKAWEGSVGRSRTPWLECRPLHMPASLSTFCLAGEDLRKTQVYTTTFGDKVAELHQRAQAEWASIIRDDIVRQTVFHELPDEKELASKMAEDPWDDALIPQVMDWCHRRLLRKGIRNIVESSNVGHTSVGKRKARSSAGSRAGSRAGRKRKASSWPAGHEPASSRQTPLMSLVPGRQPPLQL